MIETDTNHHNAHPEPLNTDKPLTTIGLLWKTNLLTLVFFTFAYLYLKTVNMLGIGLLQVSDSQSFIPLTG